MRIRGYFFFVCCFLLFSIAEAQKYNGINQPNIIFDKNHKASQHIAEKLAQSISLHSPPHSQSKSESLTQSSKDEPAANTTSTTSRPFTAISIGNEGAKNLESADNAHIYSFVNHSLIPSNTQLKNSDSYAVMLYPDIKKSIEAGLSIVQSNPNKHFQKKVVIPISQMHPLKPSLFNNYKDNQNVSIIEVDSNKLPYRQLQALFFEAAILIAIPDNQLWSGKNARWLLHQAYEYVLPVIGYSKSFIKAGALLSIYTTSDDIIQTTTQLYLDAEIRASYSNHIIYPNARIDINSSIAKVLGFDIEQLKRDIGVSAND